jgi:choline dehydrogenase-like flavoprotein
VDLKYEYIVIGSGFGGTITALILGNKLEEENNSPTPNRNGSDIKKVCILERGQWWISPEIPINDKGVIDHKPTISQYLEENKIPHDFFPYDNLKGFLKVLGSSRLGNNVKGLYDYRVMHNVHVIAGSGVGGGSLVYFNVTERPDPQVYKNWPTEKDGGPSLSEYFSKAENFLNKLYYYYCRFRKIQASKIKSISRSCKIH